MTVLPDEGSPALGSVTAKSGNDVFTVKVLQVVDQQALWESEQGAVKFNTLKGKEISVSAALLGRVVDPFPTEVTSLGQL